MQGHTGDSKFCLTVWNSDSRSWLLYGKKPAAFPRAMPGAGVLRHQRASPALDPAATAQTAAEPRPQPPASLPVVAPPGAFLSQVGALVVLSPQGVLCVPPPPPPPLGLILPIPAGPLGHVGNIHRAPQTELPGTPLYSQGPSPGFHIPGCVTLGRSLSLSGSVSQL